MFRQRDLRAMFKGLLRHTITYSVVFSSTCNLKLAGIHTVVLGTLVSL